MGPVWVLYVIVKGMQGVCHSQKLEEVMHGP